MTAEHTTHPCTARAPRLEFAVTRPRRLPLPAKRRTPRAEQMSGGTQSAVLAVRATDLLGRTQRALEVGDLDRATATAEGLLELAATSKDAGVVRLVAANVALLYRVFEARVSPLDQRIEVGIAGLDPGELALSQRAAQLLELARGGTTVRELIASCGFPRQQAARMVAGLMRRRVLVAL